MYRFGKLLLAALLLSVTSAHAQNPDSPEFEVPSRVNQFEYQPCMACHEYTEPNPNWRFLEMAPHYAEVRHGNAVMWCTSCHSLESRDKFITPAGKLVDMDKGYIVCAQCHNDVYNDWMHGAHGKRIENWQGKRTIHSCMECHNPHHGPGIRPRRPLPPPGVRKGLTRPGTHEMQRCKYSWEECVYEETGEANVKHQD